MKIKIKKVLSIIILCSILLSMFGCNNKDREENIVEKKFVEKELKIPDLQFIYDLKELNDNTVALLGEDKEGALKKYISKDKGEIWIEEDFSLIKDNKSQTIFATISTDKNVAIIDCDKSTLEDTSSTKIIKPNANLFKVDGTNNKIDLSDDDAVNIQRFNFTSNGDIYSSTSDKIVQYDGKNGNIKYKYSIDKGNIVSICSVSNYLIVVTTDSVIKYDLNTGKEDEEIEGLKNYLEYNTCVFSGNDENKIYLTNSKGLYKYTISDKVIEQVIDGSTCSLGDTNLYFQQLIEIGENIFFALYAKLNEPGYILCKYEYSEELANTSLKKLKVYSLYEDTVLKQSIIEYQKKHQDIKINYEIGIEQEANNITKSDAIKKLNTEMLAGDGPDVVLLDDMNSEYYAQKGILEDISDIVNDKKDSLFKGITNSYYSDGNTYMIPLRVKIPVIMGDRDVIEDINGLSSLSETVDSKLSQQSNQIMGIFDPEDIINSMYYTSTGKIIKDKKINEEYLKDFLNDTKKLYTTAKNKIPQKIYKNYSEAKQQYVSMYGDKYGFSKNQFIEKPLEAIQFLQPDSIKIDIGYNSSLNDIAIMLSIKNLNGNLEYKEFSGDGENIFLPKELISINSKGKNKDVAKEFISSLLDEEYQSIDQQTGLPINNDALLSIYNKNVGNDNLGSVGVDINGEIKECPTVWPTEKEFNTLLEIMNKLNKSANINTNMLDVLTKGAEKYIIGESTLDEAIKNISKGLEIQLSE